MAVSYQYNGANELIRENNHTNSYTMTYEYDSWGNLTKKQRYAYTTATDPGTPTDTKTYGYSTGDWKDQLISYGAETISYDAMGNPTSYRGKTLTWNGKELTGVTGTASYTYDMNGLRTTKTVGGVTTNYFYNNTVLMGLTSGSNTLLFSYDANGLVQAVNFNGTYYYYMRNGRGDIIKLVDADGTGVVKYSYDSWGKQLSCTSTLATTLGKLNPFRYRGYFYDEETQWYYLKSRYYDPETCRFISADVYLSTGQGVIGHNCYAYCLNNTVNGLDLGGFDAIWIQEGDSAHGYGHSGLMVQDEKGEWWYFYWGRGQNEKRDTFTNYSVDVSPLGHATDVDLKNESEFRDFLRRAGGVAEAREQKITSYYYFKGDYTNTYRYVYRYRYNSQDSLLHERYSLVFNNCAQKTLSAFLVSDSRFRIIAWDVRFLPFPNLIAKKVALLSENKDDYSFLIR